MSALEPLRASILMGRVGPPSVGSAIYCAGAHALFRAARVGFGTHVGGRSPCHVLFRGRYPQVQQVQSKAERGIGLP